MSRYATGNAQSIFSCSNNFHQPWRHCVVLQLAGDFCLCSRGSKDQRFMSGWDHVDMELPDEPDASGPHAAVPDDLGPPMRKRGRLGRPASS